jgi:hypothetical protein
MPGRRDVQIKVQKEFSYHMVSRAVESARVFGWMRLLRRGVWDAGDGVNMHSIKLLVG